MHLSAGILYFESYTNKRLHSETFPGSKLDFLIPNTLFNGLTGSISPSLSPNTPSEPCSKAFSGSKPNFLIPRALRSCAAGSESAFSILSSSLKAAVASERYADRLVGVEVQGVQGLVRQGSAPRVNAKYLDALRIAAGGSGAGAGAEQGAGKQPGENKAR